MLCISEWLTLAQVLNAIFAVHVSGITWRYAWRNVPAEKLFAACVTLVYHQETSTAPGQVKNVLTVIESVWTWLLVTHQMQTYFDVFGVSNRRWKTKLEIAEPWVVTNISEALGLVEHQTSLCYLVVLFLTYFAAKISCCSSVDKEMCTKFVRSSYEVGTKFVLRNPYFIIVSRSFWVRINMPSTFQFIAKTVGEVQHYGRHTKLKFCSEGFSYVWPVI